MVDTVIDIRAPLASATVNGGVFLDTANIGSGTGNYSSFLVLGDNDGTLAGFNSDDAGPPIPRTPI
jgi:hypothetical protein